jgi:hypothetical protein
MLDIAIGQSKLRVSIDVGDYGDPVELAGTIQDNMNAAASGDLFQVTYDPRTDKFKFMGTRSFTLNFHGACVKHTHHQNTNPSYPANSIGRLLGFPACAFPSFVDEDTSSVYRNTVLAPFRKNFTADDVLVVNIDMLDLNQSTSDTLDKSFAIIPRNGVYPEHAKTMYYDDHILKTFNTPMRLSKIRVEVRDFDGNMYDFQNHDHMMEFSVETNIRTRS